MMDLVVTYKFNKAVRGIPSIQAPFIHTPKILAYHQKSNIIVQAMLKFWWI